MIEQDIQLKEQPNERIMQVKVQLTETDFGEVSSLYPKLRKKSFKEKGLVLAVSFIIIFLIIVAVVQNLDNGAAGAKTIDFLPNLGLPVVCLITYFVLRIANPFLIKKSSKKAYNTNKAAHKEQLYTFSSDGIEVTSENLNLKLNYSDFHRVYITKNYIVLMESERLMRAIPKRCFDREESMGSVLSLLEENIPQDKYKHISK